MPGTHVDCAGRRALLLMPLEKVVTCQLACREARQIRGALIVAIAGDEPPGLFFLTEAQDEAIDTDKARLSDGPF